MTVSNQSLRAYPINGEFGKFGRALELQLFDNVQAVRFYGLGANVKVFGSFTRGQALAQEFKDPKLALGQCRKDGVIGAARTTAREPVHDSLSHRLANANLATQHPADGLDEFFAAGAF